MSTQNKLQKLEEWKERIEDRISRIESLYAPDQYDVTKVKELRGVAQNLESDSNPTPLLERANELVEEIARSIEEWKQLDEKIQRYENKIEYREEKLEYHRQEGNEEKAEWNRRELESLREYLENYRFWKGQRN